jgi:hypothetical protein
MQSPRDGRRDFNDGESVELNSDDHPHLMEKLQGNQHFEFEAGEDDEKPRRGRPPNRDLKAGIEEARDHDFEADRAATKAGANWRKPSGRPKSGRTSAGKEPVT